MTIMTESATKQVERLATAIREMQGQGMKVNKNRLSKYMNEEKGDNISIVTVGKYFDQAIKQVNGSSSKASTSPSIGTAGDKGKSELLCFSHENARFSPCMSYDALSDEKKKKLQTWTALGEKELIDQLCLALEIDWPEKMERLLGFEERFKKIELIGFERPTAARFTKGFGIEFSRVNIVFRVEYSAEYSDEIDGLDGDELDESLAETRQDVVWRIALFDLNPVRDKRNTGDGYFLENTDSSVEVIDALSPDTVFVSADSRGWAINAARLPAGTVAQPAIWEADRAIKQVNGGSSKASTSPSIGTAGDKGRSELLSLYIEWASYTQGETSDGEWLEGNAIADAIPSSWRSLPKTELTKKIQQVVSPLFDGDLDFTERFRKIELLGFDGPSVVSIDAYGIHLKHIDFIVRVDYSNEVEDLDDDDMDETRMDLYHLLMVDLDLDEATLNWGELGSYGAEVIDSVPDDMVERHEVWNAS
jgi:hypothetical protein